MLGVSPDSVVSHRRFREALNLPFNLLSDPDFEVSQAWDSVKTSDDGAKPTGVRRGHYVIDEEGKIVDAQTPVKAAESAKLALERV